MSDELDEYLESLPINVFKLVNGDTIIARIVELPPDEELPFIISQPFSLHLDASLGKGSLSMHEWLYGCNAQEVFLEQSDIIATHEAILKMKNFYSKCVIRNKMEDEDFEEEEDSEEDSEYLNPFQFLQSLVDGLEPKDSTKDEDILSPWRNRMEWKPVEGPKQDDRDSFDN
jgi:hypothetical protein